MCHVSLGLPCLPSLAWLQRGVQLLRCHDDALSVTGHQRCEDRRQLVTFAQVQDHEPGPGPETNERG